MEISCAFPTTLESHEQIALAEELGFDRAWLYDTPQQSPDVWMMLALAAKRTERIGLGPGVLGAEPAPPDGQRGGDRGPGRARARPRHGCVRHGLHRSPGDGLSRHPLEVHNRARVVTLNVWRLRHR